MLGTEDFKTIASLLYPNVIKTPEDFYKKYPKRNLKPGSIVTRVAPSPTGFFHIGTGFASLVAERVAHLSGGKFFLRIEDTDTKREVVGGVAQIVNALHKLGINMDEGFNTDETQFGEYGPYKQTERVEIYHTFAKLLVERGFAYPCFMTAPEIDEIRKQQEHSKLRPGIYGEYARNRNLSAADVKTKLATGEQWVLRLRSTGNIQNKSVFNDFIKGNVDVTENDLDIVLIKSDGIPLYHFAHVVDDYLMDANYIFRADEWLPSLPIHLEIFKSFGWDAPKYAHFSPIMKMDGSSKRKLSKRKDPEANIEFYWEAGYPVEGVLDYLMNIANSSFEDWRKTNPKASYLDFPLKSEKLNNSGALFDLVKLADVCKNFISTLDNTQVYDKVLVWSSQYDATLHSHMVSQKDLCLRIFNIERTGEKVRKDLAMWKDVMSTYFYFFEDLFEQATSPVLPANITMDAARAFLSAYLEDFKIPETKEIWFNHLKDVAEKLGYARDLKSYKENPSGFKGSVSDLAMILRVALTKKTNTPDLYEIMSILGVEKVISRLQKF